MAYFTKIQTRQSGETIRAAQKKHTPDPVIKNNEKDHFKNWTRWSEDEIARLKNLKAEQTGNNDTDSSGKAGITK